MEVPKITGSSKLLLFFFILKYKIKYAFVSMERNTVRIPAVWFRRSGRAPLSSTQASMAVIQVLCKYWEKKMDFLTLMEILRNALTGIQRKRKRFRRVCKVPTEKRRLEVDLQRKRISDICLQITKMACLLRFPYQSLGDCFFIQFPEVKDRTWI